MSDGSTPRSPVGDLQRLSLEGSQRALDQAGDLLAAYANATRVVLDGQVRLQRTSLSMARAATLAPLTMLSAVTPASAAPATATRSFVEAQYDTTEAVHDAAVETLRASLDQAEQYETSREKLDELAVRVERLLETQQQTEAELGEQIDRLEELTSDRFDTVEATLGEGIEATRTDVDDVEAEVRKSQDALQSQLESTREDIDEQVGAIQEQVETLRDELEATAAERSERQTEREAES